MTESEKDKLIMDSVCVVLSDLDEAIDINTNHGHDKEYGERLERVQDELRDLYGIQRRKTI